MRCTTKLLNNVYGQCKRAGAGSCLPVVHPAIVETVAEAPPLPGAEIVPAAQAVANISFRPL